MIFVVFSYDDDESLADNINFVCSPEILTNFTISTAFNGRKFQTTCASF